jgi:hypothetical protein
MRIIPFILFITTIFGQCQNLTPTEQDGYTVICTMQDSARIGEILKSYGENGKQKTHEISAQIAKSFLDAPYVGKTLEIGEEESLVVNVVEFDCTTLVETCLALAKTITSDKATLENYFNWLRTIRYRDGILWGYESRLHYFSEWIRNNQKKGIVDDITLKLGGIEFPNEVYFMGTHPELYRQLRADSCMIERMKHLEELISKESYFYIPKEKVVSIEGKLTEGMIIGITTNIKGLDIVHTGILVMKNNRIHLLHASSDEKKVVISDKPLSDYLLANKRQTGIMVLEIK